MSFSDETDGERRRRPPAAPESGADRARSPTVKKRHAPEVGHALRAAYQRTLDEDVPPEMLDLLGKLG